MTPAMLSDLRRQSAEFWRRKEPHNHRPPRTTVRTLRRRHWRRITNRRLKQQAMTWA